MQCMRSDNCVGCFESGVSEMMILFDAAWGGMPPSNTSTVVSL